jgi:transaldolase
MEFFIDTANLDDIREALSWGVIDGCTTNPKIVATEKVDFETRMKEIIKLVPGPVSIEVTSNDWQEMVKEADIFTKWGPNVVVKIPMSLPGMKAVKILSEKGIKTNVTAAMCMKQAVFAAKAGATYVSLFWARIEDMGYDATAVVSETVEVFNTHKFKCKIIIGSFRQISHINQALLTGAHVLTIPPNVLKEMAWNPRTDSTIDEFLQFWGEYKKAMQKK